MRGLVITLTGKLMCLPTAGYCGNSLEQGSQGRHVNLRRAIITTQGQATGDAKVLRLALNMGVQVRLRADRPC